MVHIPVPHLNTTNPDEDKCDPAFYQEITASVDPIAATLHRDVANYDRVVYYIPKMPECEVGGQGEPSGKRAWVNANSSKERDVQAISHELGHNLGLGHAHARSCRNAANEPVAFSATCTDHEYADANSAMGNLHSGGFPASQRSQLGWMSGKTANLIGVNETVTISPIELTHIEAGRSPKQAIRINDNGTILWVEYRQNVGVDTHQAPTPGVLIYQEIGGRQSETFLLDMTPGSLPVTNPDFPGRDHEDAGLAAGATVRNPLSQLRITVNWANSTGANVTVTFS
jgi:hypothetical protein